jgi:hypothetical protein
MAVTACPGDPASTVNRSGHDPSKTNLIEYERTKNSACEIERPQIAGIVGVKAQASEPLVGERSHGIKVSGERTIY